MFLFIIFFCLACFVAYQFIKYSKKRAVASKWGFYIKQYADMQNDRDTFIKKYPEIFPFIANNFRILREINYPTKDYNLDYNLVEQMVYGLHFWSRDKFNDIQDKLYRKEICKILTHKIQDKELSKLITDQCKNIEYIEKIKDNGIRHSFDYNLLNHLYMAGNPVEGEGVKIKYPKVLERINAICNEYPYGKERLLNNLHKIGNNFFTEFSRISSSWFYDDINNICSGYLHMQYGWKGEAFKEALKDIYQKKLIAKEVYDNYSNILQIDLLKNAQESEYKKWSSTCKDISYTHLKHCVTNGDINDYTILSEYLTFVLLHEDCPDAYDYKSPYFSSSEERTETKKKMLDANGYGINPLIFFKPENFEEQEYPALDPRFRHYGCFAKLKADIDNALAEVYPVPDFLDHAYEILKSYKQAYDMINTFDSRQYIQVKNELSKMSKYEIFGFNVGIIDKCHDILYNNGDFNSELRPKLISWIVGFDDNDLEEYTKNYFDKVNQRFVDFQNTYKPALILWVNKFF